MEGPRCTSAPESFSGRRRNDCSSIRASPSPMYTPPMTWPRASVGLSARPMSCAIQIFGTWIQPVRSSTSVSTTQALKLYAGDGPTPAPLYLPGALGGEYEPTADSVPSAASAIATASTNDIARLGSSAAYTLPCEKTTRSGSVPSVSETAAATLARRRSAAWTAALPAMMVTRLEYEPRSTGVMPVSPVTQRTTDVSTPSVSATIAASTSSEPCPISVAPQYTMTVPERSSRTCTPECGILFQ